MKKLNLGELRPLNFQGSESYKSLRTNIQFCGDDVKVIAFTSSIPNEGKSILVYRTSCSMAETGKKVLMIDTDIRKSVLVNRLGSINREKDFLSIFPGSAAWMSVCMRPMWKISI